MKLPPQVEAVFAKIDAMSIRERALVAATVFAAIWALWDALMLQPLSALEDVRREQLASTSAQVAQLNQSIQDLAASSRGDADTEARRRLAELRTRAIELDAELRTVTRELVPPTDMPALLESVLERTGRLRLLGMEALPAQPVLAEGEETGYYRHGLAVNVSGSYLDALQYLRALESLQWRFFWESVELEVVDHPTSRIRIIVYTLGQRRGVLGV